jgi:thioredoxin 1
MVLEVTDSTIADTLNTNKVVLIDFYAEWCGPCRMYGPILDEFSNENPDVIIGKVNVDNNDDIAAKYGIRGIPTTIIFKNGEVVNRVSGVILKDKLIELVKV